MFINPVFNELLKTYKTNKLSHAYLIETNDIPMLNEDLKTFIKMINCPNTYKQACSNCNLCNLINQDYLPSLKIINPDGQNIKKAQVDELKQSFSSIPIYSKYNVYIINNADKLNSSSANSMLKFIEEPTPNIIGFFITNNKDVMMDTIKSRCQSLVINYEASSNYPDDLMSIAKRYLNSIINTNNIIDNKKLINKLEDRKTIEYMLKIILDIYHSKLMQDLNKKANDNLLKDIKLTDSKDEIIKKLNIIVTILGNMLYNTNLELTLDRFVIEMRGNYE